MKYLGKLGTFAIILLSMVIFTSCQMTEESVSSQSTMPNELYEKDNDIDMFVYEDVAYINSSDIDWIQEKTFRKGELAGKIKESDVTEDFQNWDSTVLAQGTEIYKSDDSMILLAECENELIPYLKYVEG